MERRDRYRGPPRRKGFRNGPRKKKQFIKKFRVVVVLDVLIHGHLEEDKPSWAKTPIAQVLTFPDFVLYEVRVNKNSVIQVQDQKTYEEFLNEDKLRDVLKKINYDELTSTSKALILPIIEKEVLE